MSPSGPDEPVISLSDPESAARPGDGPAEIETPIESVIDDAVDAAAVPGPRIPAEPAAGVLDGETEGEAAPADERPEQVSAPDGAPDGARAAAVASRHEGMGAVVYDTGVAFRVWAPHAEAVAVAGSFNGWRADAAPLAHEGNGYWSVDVEGARAGDQYRFVIRGGGRELWRSDPYARDLEHSQGNCIVVGTAFDWGDDSAYRMPPWNELVIYELHVGTFNDVPGGTPGSFDSVVEKLDHLRSLGINAIELMPSSEFASDWSWGYNPAYIFALESAFGGPMELKRLVREAHARGIAVILDVVYNHLGPSDLDLWQFDGWSHDGKGGIYFYNDWRAHTPWGDTRPDYGREEVRQYLRDNAVMWLDEFRMDGLRWDATAYIRNVHGNNDNPSADLGDGWALMQGINRETDGRFPWKLQVAEDLRGNEWITRQADAGGAGFDTQWDGEFVHPVRRAVIAQWDESRSMGEVARAIAHRYNGDPLRRVIYTESHDEVANGKARVPHEIAPDDPGSRHARKRSTLGAALVFTSPGIPMLFQGQEILEDEWFHDQDPVDWEKLRRFPGIHLLYTDLVRLRRNWFDHTRGLRGPHVNVHHVNDADKVVAFHRWENGGPRDDVIVVANFADRAYDRYEIGFPRAGEWKVRLNSDWRGYGGDYDDHPSWTVDAGGPPRDGLPFSAGVSIGRYTAVILSQDG